MSLVLLSRAAPGCSGSPGAACPVPELGDPTTPKHPRDTHPEQSREVGQGWQRRGQGSTGGCGTEGLGTARATHTPTQGQPGPLPSHRWPPRPRKHLKSQWEKLQVLLLFIIQK